MLTPLGTGAKASGPRRWPRVLFVLVVLGALGAAAYGTWWWLTVRDDAAPASVAGPSKTCTTPTPKAPKKLPDPSAITVVVANGTDRAGLAVQSADVLAARGFDVAGIGNTDKPVKEGIAVVRYAKADLDAAVVVASYLPMSQLQVAGDAKDADVTVWLGPDFERVSASSDADVDAVALQPGRPVCHKQR